MNAVEKVHDEMNPRTCIVTRESGDAEALIRFVADPQGEPWLALQSASWPISPGSP